MKIIFTVILLGILTAFLDLSNSFAQMPLHPDLLKKLKSNSIDTAEVRRLRERGIDAGWRSKELLKQSAINNSLRVFGPAAPPTGTYRALVILVSFSDKQFQTPPSYFDNLLFSGSAGSLNHYYKEISYNKLDIVTVNLPSAIGTVTAPQPYSYYVDNKKGFGNYPKNAQRLVEDVVKAVNPVVDFSKYDNDGDGFVDALFIIHAGPGYEFTQNTNDIHSHAWAINPLIMDGVMISHYSMEPEYMRKPGDMTMGVFAHEMGHSAFGLPDLYDTDYSSNGLGSWSLMSSGSWNGTNNNGDSPAHPDAWSMIQMGFASPVSLNANTNVTLTPMENDPVVYKMQKFGQSSKEYFLLENRQLIGYDSWLPAGGLLVYHVDESADTGDNKHEWYPGKTNQGHYRVALVQADGLWDLERKIDQGDGGDPFPGTSHNTFLDYQSVPDSRYYNSAYTNIAVRNINQSGDNIYADLVLDDDLILSSKELNFGSLEVNTGSSTIGLNIINNGSSPVTINDISFSNPSFILINTNLPFIVQPNSTMNAKFQFTPTVKGQFTDTIKITTSPAKYVEDVIISAVSYVINPVSKDIIYASLGSSGDGKIISISPQNGTGTEIGSSGFSQIKSLAIHRGTKQLYGLLQSDSTSQIVKVNSQAGDAYVKSPVNLSLTSIAFDNSDNLFGVTGNGIIYTINPNTGSYNMVWATGLSISSIIFNPLDNLLWAAAGTNSTDKDMIYKLNPVDKSITQIGKTGFNTYTNAIAFDSMGNLYGVKGNALQSNQLISINTTTGAGAEIGSTGFRGVKGIAMLSGDATRIDNSIVKNILSYRLDQNYPNPFNPTTVINYQIPEKTLVTIKVFNLLGQEVSTLVQEEKAAGMYSVKFNGGNLPSGLYIYQFKTAKFSEARKMVLLK